MNPTPDTDSTVRDADCSALASKMRVGPGRVCSRPFQREGINFLGADVASEDR